jgi:glyoxylase-like metal-dependent hydrolase (beta-lactamase superfamily II)
MEAFGHTPGHLIFEVASGDRRLWLTADTANHFVASLQKPDWEVRFDQDKDAAAATRKRVFDQIAEERIPFIGYHMPFPAIGYAETSTRTPDRQSVLPDRGGAIGSAPALNAQNQRKQPISAMIATTSPRDRQTFSQGMPSLSPSARVCRPAHHAMTASRQLR